MFPIYHISQSNKGEILLINNLYFNISVLRKLSFLQPILALKESIKMDLVLKFEFMFTNNNLKKYIYL
jgi:hypothetical protein